MQPYKHPSTLSMKESDSPKASHVQQVNQKVNSRSSTNDRPPILRPEVPELGVREISRQDQLVHKHQVDQAFFHWHHEPPRLPHQNRTAGRECGASTRQSRLPQAFATNPHLCPHSKTLIRHNSIRFRARTVKAFHRNLTCAPRCSRGDSHLCVQLLPLECPAIAPCCGRRNTMVRFLQPLLDCGRNVV